MVYAKQQSDGILGTLDKGLHVLQVIADSDVPNGLTLTELGTEVGMHRTTLFRILKTLEARNFVNRDSDTDRYQLGGSVLGLASVLLRNLSVCDIARPILQGLSLDTQEVVFLTVRSLSEIMTVEAFDSVQEISLRADVGDRRPMYCTASGKAILAFLSAEEVDEILSLGMPPLTSRTITSEFVMHHELEKVRNLGFAWDDEERIEGVCCVAAPIFNSKGGVVAAISIAAPAMRTSFKRMRELGLLVQSSADAISAELGSTRRAKATSTISATTPLPGDPGPVEAASVRRSMNLADLSTD